MEINQETKDRFFEQVDKQENGCWIWRGTRDHKNYGRFYVRGKAYMAHRFSHRLATGRDLQRGQFLHHECRVRPCCNPDHLRVVDHATNMKLAAKAGAWSGEANSQAKRSEEEVHTIRILRRAGVPMATIATRLNIPLRSAYAVLEGHESWQHIKTSPEHVEKLLLGEKS